MKRLIVSVLAVVGLTLGIAACGSGSSAHAPAPAQPNNATYMAGWNWQKDNSGDCQSMAQDQADAVDNPTHLDAAAGEATFRDFFAGCMNQAGLTVPAPKQVTIQAPTTTTPNLSAPSPAVYPNPNGGGESAAPCVIHPGDHSHQQDPNAVSTTNAPPGTPYCTPYTAPR